MTRCFSRLKRMHEDTLFNSDSLPPPGPSWPQQCLPSSGGEAHLQGVMGRQGQTTCTQLCQADFLKEHVHAVYSRVQVCQQFLSVRSPELKPAT